MKTIAGAFLFLAGCVSADPPAVRAANEIAPIAKGTARIVLIRPESQCDSSIYPIVVDENGHFVGEMSQNSQTSIDMPTGDHLLVASPSVDARVEKYPDVDPVGASIFHLSEGETRYFEVFIPQRLAAQCWHFTTFALRRLRDNDADLHEWLQVTKPIAIDRAAGEAEIASDPQSVRDHIASAHRLIRESEALRAQRARTQKSPDGENVARDSEDTK